MTKSELRNLTPIPTEGTISKAFGHSGLGFWHKIQKRPQGCFCILAREEANCFASVQNRKTEPCPLVYLRTGESGEEVLSEDESE